MDVAPDEFLEDTKSAPETFLTRYDLRMLTDKVHMDLIPVHST